MEIGRRARELEVLVMNIGATGNSPIKVKIGSCSVAVTVQKVAG